MDISFVIAVYSPSEERDYLIFKEDNSFEFTDDFNNATKFNFHSALKGLREVKAKLQGKECEVKLFGIEAVEVINPLRGDK